MRTARQDARERGGASADLRRVDRQDGIQLTKGARRLSRILTVEDLKAVPEGALIQYRCDEDDTIWYEPLEQVLRGAPLHFKNPSGSHWCPYCDGHVWPMGYLVVARERQ